MDDVTELPARHRLDVDEYYRMGEAGVFGDQRIELINGELIDMAPIGQGHEGTVGALNEALVLAFAGRAIVWPQNSIRLDRWNVPQPDFAVLRRRPDFYRTGERPGPADVLLLVEVADSSLKYDQRVKLPLYARAGIPEFWIVDVKRRILHAHRAPAGDGYAETTTHHSGDMLALALAPDIVVGLNLLFS
jgi:Uma2 family endonuclease